MSQNMYYKNPKFGLAVMHVACYPLVKLQGNSMHVLVNISATWKSKDCEFRIIGGSICHSCGPLNRTLSVPVLTDVTLG